MTVITRKNRFSILEGRVPKKKHPAEKRIEAKKKKPKKPPAPKKKPVPPTPPLSKVKYTPNHFFRMKNRALELGANHLRGCYADKIAREAIYHGKTAEDSEWFKEKIKKYSHRQIRHYLRKYSSPPLDEKARVEILTREKNRNRDKTLRKMKFDPEFRAFYLPECFIAIEKMFGKKAFYTLKKTLNDPAAASPFWAAQFLAAHHKIADSLPADNVYEAVTQSKEFTEAFHMRKVFINALNEILMEARKSG